jgi:hypothetical protein
MNFLKLASVVFKMQRRMPARIAGMQGWALGRDRFYASHWLA